MPKNTRWALIVSLNPGSIAGGSGIQYFIGRLRRDAFHRRTPGAGTHFGGDAADAALWADYGKDFYAAVSWSDVPREDGRRIWLGWMNNWQYAQSIPTSPWRSVQSLPRTLALRDHVAGHPPVPAAREGAAAASRPATDPCRPANRGGCHLPRAPGHYWNLAGDRCGVRGRHRSRVRTEGAHGRAGRDSDWDRSARRSALRRPDPIRAGGLPIGLQPSPCCPTADPKRTGEPAPVRRLVLGRSLRREWRGGRHGPDLSSTGQRGRRAVRPGRHRPPRFTGSVAAGLDLATRPGRRQPLDRPIGRAHDDHNRLLLTSSGSCPWPFPWPVHPPACPGNGSVA